MHSKAGISITCLPTRRWCRVESRRGRNKKRARRAGIRRPVRAGYPRVSDGSLLFLQHMISKMKPWEKGEPGLPLSSTVHRFLPDLPFARANPGWIIEHDWLESIVALPDQLFYNTGIFIYLWIVTNRKEKSRRGKIQLVNATGFFKKMRKSLGNKRNEICVEQRNQITNLYGAFQENEFVRIFDNEDFGYHRITVERPLRRNYAVTDKRLARVTEGTKFGELAASKKRKDASTIAAEEAEGKRQQQAILSAIVSLKKLGLVKNRDKFTNALKDALKKSDIAIRPRSSKKSLMRYPNRMKQPISAPTARETRTGTALRDYENVPLKENIATYMKREVLPHVPDACVDESKTKVGYEINFNRISTNTSRPGRWKRLRWT